MEETPHFYLMFGRLEGKVDTLLASNARIDLRLDDVETRLGVLETLRNQGLGALRLAHFVWATMGACIALFTTEIKEYVFR